MSHVQKLGDSFFVKLRLIFVMLESVQLKLSAGEDNKL